MFTRACRWTPFSKQIRFISVSRWHSNTAQRVSDGSSAKQTISFLYHLPNPTTDYHDAETGRNRPSFIYDPHHYIATRDADKLDDMLMAAKTSKLAEMGIVVISSFEQYGHTGWYDVAKLTQKWCKYTHDYWQIGDKHTNNGVLIFVTAEDRYLYISTGAGLKDILTDEYLTDYLIKHKLKQLLKDEEYGEALIVAVADMLDRVKYLNCDDETGSAAQQRYKTYQETQERKSYGWTVAFFAWCLFMLWDRINATRKDLRSVIASLQSDVEHNRLHMSCPICLEYFAENEEEGTTHLVCGHNYCTQCLQEWMECNNADDTGTHDEGSLYCPICAKVRESAQTETLIERTKEDVCKEIEFRLIDEKQRQYKWGDIVSRQMIMEWTESYLNGEDIDWTDSLPEPAETRTYVRHTSHRSRSRKNDDYSYSGGSHSFGGGGGGGGGGW